MATRMDKADYAAMKTEERKALQAKLGGFLKDALASKDSIAELTAHYRISGLYGYSFYNSMLIKMQGGTIAQSYNKWKSLERMVNKGEKSHISVLAPMFKKEKLIDGTEESKLIGFRLVPVFDVKQTDGKALEYDHNSADDMEVSYERVKAVITGLTNADVVEEITGNARGYSDGKKMVVSSMSNDADKTKTMIHEASHHLCHTGNTKAESVSYDAAEVEAEATTMLVLSFLGMDYELSKGYVASYKSGIADARAELIIRTADKMIKALKKVMTDEERFMVAV